MKNKRLIFGGGERERKQEGHCQILVEKEKK
jgi:hypothetical protein